MFAQKALLLSAAVSVVGLAQGVNAAVITFEGSTDITDNFTVMAGTVTRSSNGASNDYMLVKSDDGKTSGSASVVYDTTPIDGATTKNLFTLTPGGDALTVKYEISRNSSGTNSGVGVYFIKGDDRTQGYVAYLNVDSSGTDNIRFSSSANPSTAGVAGLSANYHGDFANAASFVPVTVTYSVNASNQGIMSLAFGNGSLSSAVIPSAYTQVEVGLRFGAQQANGEVRVDNFEVIAPVPEPGTLALAGMSGAALLPRRRRHASR